MKSQTIQKENPASKYMWEFNPKINDIDLISKNSPKNPNMIYYGFYDLPDKYIGLLLLKNQKRIF